MAVNGKSFAVLGQTPLTLYRVHAEDKTVYVLYDVTADVIRGIYADAHLRCPVCGLWHWAEREIGNAVRAAVEKEKAKLEV